MGVVAALGIDNADVILSLWWDDNGGTTGG